jgi:SAM-dependent methyltransferase
MISTRQLLRGTWRLVQPLRYSRQNQLSKLPSLYQRFWQERHQFVAMGGEASFDELAPCLFDREANTQSGGGHYFYQDIWALNKLAEFKPAEHHDVGSRFDGFVGQATAICPVISWDIRPPNFQLPRFQFRQGSILNLPVPDQSISSLSCLHVAEHIGLGRYGDSLDPEGTTKALHELMRVLAPGGQLLFSMPIGLDRVCFNAQRIWHPEKPINILKELDLSEFKAVDDTGNFCQEILPTDLINAKYSCGLYCFVRR